MPLKERVLYHQVHPIKLATDGLSAVAALWLLDEHRLWAALLVMFVPAILASVMLLSVADLTAIQDSSMGRYLRRHMTRSVEGTRLAAMAIMSVGAWRHQWWLVGLGPILVVAAWTSGLIPSKGRSSHDDDQLR